ncbi:LptF/LptG family permease [Fluviispira multicolorata]|uniref:LptF/LptG family permease n=1 Tax=Fluviispira multicolorata TaxID=2654512 RepID=A0A833N567_9BACT|nr:LptF/LptG family permease [Fluviispira multicolorata]KAB8032228.1 LptF/LptG family permease [Fluviispira multicolorata]
MAVLQKLDRLMATEIISLTFVVTASLSSIMIMAKLPRYADLLFSAPDSVTTFLMLLLYIFPNVLKLTVPISLLLASAIVTIRMAADRELEAWMASGVSIFRFAAMPTVLGIVVMLISLFSALYFEPYSTQQFNKFKWIQTRGVVEAVLANTIREKSFIYDVPSSEKVNLSLYFQNVSTDKSEFKDVFMGIKPPNENFFSIVVSETGGLKKTLNNGLPDYVFSLHNGTAYSERESKQTLLNLTKEFPNTYFQAKVLPANSAFNLFPKPSDLIITEFKDMDISLVNTFKSKFKTDATVSGGADQFYPAEFLKYLNQQKAKSPDWKNDRTIIEKYLFILKQISIPLSTLFLPIIGVCLGIQDPRRKQYGVYFAIGLVIFSLYASLSVCQQLALSFIISPFSILFVTPCVLMFIILFLLRWRLRHPPSTGFIAFVRDDLIKIKFFTKKD